MTDKEVLDMTPETICARYRRLIYRVAHKYEKLRSYYPYIDRSDLVQVGRLALLEAQAEYKPESGKSFLGYAYWKINSAIAHALGVKYVRKGEYILRPSEAHLDAPVRSDDPDGEKLIDRVAEQLTTDPEAELIQSATQKVINAWIDTLPKIQSDLIRSTVIGDEKIGHFCERYGMRYNQVRDMRQRAFAKLRRNMRKLDILDDAECYRKKSVSAVLRTGRSVVEDIAFNRIDVLDNMRSRSDEV